MHHILIRLFIKQCIKKTDRHITCITLRGVKSKDLSQCCLFCKNALRKRATAALDHKQAKKGVVLAQYTRQAINADGHNFQFRIS